MFKLSDLTAYNDITVQCHDTPDADAIASAFAVSVFLRRFGKKPRIVYSGFNKITKCNLRIMTESLNIPLEYVDRKQTPGKTELLVTVDCQYGEGNVKKIEANTVAVIDHHLETQNAAFGIIRPQLGSCSTLIWDLMRKEDFDFNSDKNVCTALYYGLYSDTNNFAELRHPLDRDMRDALEFYIDINIFKNMRNSNLSLEELQTAGHALINNANAPGKRYALFEAKPCDPNILGFISDLGMQIEGVDLCVVWCCLTEGVKLSVRSCSREIMASEYTEFLVSGIGSGGGHKEKAGAFISSAVFDKINEPIKDFINRRTGEYFESYDMIMPEAYTADTRVMKRYKKRRLLRAYAVSDDVFPEGTPMMLRTLEGDANITASKNTYLIIGIKGEVYPMNAEKFKKSYELAEPGPAEEYEYNPTAKNESTGAIKELLPYAKACMSTDESHIYAMPLKRNTKVFANWTPTGYMYGIPGDYLAVRADDLHDVYIIRSDIFPITYEAVE